MSWVTDDGEHEGHVASILDDGRQSHGSRSRDRDDGTVTDDPPEHVAHRALIHTAQLIDSNTEASDSSDLRILNERLERGAISHEEIMLAALPAEPTADEPALVAHIADVEVLEVLDQTSPWPGRTLFADASETSEAQS